MHLPSFLISALLLLHTASCPAQKLKYTIRLKDELVGNMTAQRSHKPTTTIRINSLISMEKMIKIEFQYIMESTYQKGKLLVSRTIQKINGQEQVNTSTTLDNNQYRVISKSGNSTYNSSAIQFNLCRMYFEEPVGIKEVWSDTFGKMLSLKPAGKNRYELVLPDGKSNYYTYYKGICTLVETETPMGKVTFQLG